MRSLSGLAAAYGFHLHAGRIFRCVLWIRFVPCRTSFGRFSHRTVYIQSTKPVAWLAMRPLRGLKFRLPAKNRLDQFRSCLNPNRSLDFGEIARLCHAACFSPSRRRSGLRRGVARIRMRTEAGKMPESLTFPIKNGLGVSNNRFGFKQLLIGLAFIEGGFGRDFIAIDVFDASFSRRP